MSGKKNHSDGKKNHSDDLCELIRNGARKEEIEDYLKENPKAVDKDDKGGLDPLIEAIICSILGVVNVILNAYPEAAAEKDYVGRLPLHYAASNNSNLDIVKLIYRTYPEAAKVKDNNGNLPLHYAANRNENPDVVEIILDPEAAAEKVRMLLNVCPEAATEKNNDGNLPLHVAAKHYNTEAVKLLLNVCPEAATEKNNDGNLPLHCAAKYDNTKAVKLLFKKNPRAIVIKDNNGKTPLEKSIQHSRYYVMKYSCIKDVIEFLESALETYMDSAPKEFICPITQSIMEDPVIDEDGGTYERVAIEKWFDAHDTSPLTNVVLESKKVIPNRALKSLIDSYMGK